MSWTDSGASWTWPTPRTRRRRRCSAAGDPYFRADLVRPVSSATVPAGFGVVVVLDGTGELTGSNTEPVSVKAGDVLAVPHAAGDVTVTGAVGAVWNRPPAPDQAGVGT